VSCSWRTVGWQVQRGRRPTRGRQDYPVRQSLKEYRPPHFNDSTAVFAHGSGHCNDQWPYAQHGRFGVDRAYRLGRPLEVSEEDGRHLAGRIDGVLWRLRLVSSAAFATKLRSLRNTVRLL